MANAPMRPPNRKPGGRPPEGPSVARTKRPLTPEIVRDRLTVATVVLAGLGEGELVEAVNAVLAPRGWELLKKPLAKQSNPNMSLFMNKDLKDAIVAAAAESADGNLTDDVDRAFRLFMAGEFTPTPPVRSRRGSNLAKTNLNVRPSGTFKDEAEELAEAKSAELGWKVSASRVAISYLLEKYGIREEDFTVPAGGSVNVAVWMPGYLRSHFREVEAGREDVSLNRLAEDGFRAVLAGEWIPPNAPPSRDARLNVRVETAVHEELRKRLPVVTAQAGYPVSMTSVVTEWLKKQLGEPETGE